MSTPQINTRQPTGQPSWPLYLVEGPEKTGKSYLAAQLTTSDRFSRAFWIDWGEGSADEYAAMPGANYEVVVHDGTFSNVANQVAAIHEYAKAQKEAGKAPALLVIDSMTAEWEALKEQANRIAVESPAGRRKLEKDPGADVPIPMHAWNQAGEKHGRLMRLLMTFPGVVVMTARGKEVAEIGENGKPVEGSKVYKVEGHKNLAFDASVVIRLSRDAEPKVVGVRSLNSGIRPGKDKPQPLGGRTLEDFTWGVLFKDASPAVRDVTEIETRSPAAQQSAPVQEEAPPQPAPAPEPEPEPANPAQDTKPQQASKKTRKPTGDASQKWKEALNKSRGNEGMLNKLYSSAVRSFGETHEFTEEVKAAIVEDAGQLVQQAKATLPEESDSEPVEEFDWEGAIDDAERDGDRESLQIYVDTLESQRGPDDVKRKIALAALRRLDTQQPSAA